jgi:hypothetical protein
MDSPNALDRLLISLGLMEPLPLKTYPFYCFVDVPLSTKSYLAFCKAGGKLQPEVHDNIVVTKVIRKKAQLKGSLVLHEFVKAEVFLSKEASEENPRAGVSLIFDRSADPSPALDGIYTSLPIEETLSDSIHNSAFPCSTPIAVILVNMAITPSIQCARIGPCPSSRGNWLLPGGYSRSTRPRQGPTPLSNVLEYCPKHQRNVWRLQSLHP